MNILEENIDCLTAPGVTVTQLSAANLDVDVFEEFLAELLTNKVNYLCEHSNVAGFFYINTIYSDNRGKEE